MSGLLTRCVTWPRTPPLPVLTPGNPNPTCLATVLDGKPLYMAEAGMVADQLAGAVG